jgi:hypothetical protein
MAGRTAPVTRGWPAQAWGGGAVSQGLLVARLEKGGALIKVHLNQSLSSQLGGPQDSTMGLPSG